jgi:hypothetical protein
VPDDPLTIAQPREGIAAELRARLDRLRDSAAYRHYERARDAVLRLKTLEAARRESTHEPSAYWQEELSNFEYMLDASPLIVEKLRHHTYHITGLRVYDYRSNRRIAQRKFAEKLEALVAADGAGLLVPEAPELGGFGFEIDGRLYNIDTLKFHEVLIALNRGAVLDGLRTSAERKLVWEIGAGWGGFPYQFKTLCPNVTYVITDFPELFLFSATYLLTLFPGARVRFYGDVAPDQTFAGWEALDFIFIPDTFHHAVRPARVDLTVNMVSFQEMTTQQVEAYVRRAHELECPFLYSLNRDRSHYNRELSSVRSILSKYYWPHECKVMPVSYTKMLDEEPEPPEKEYKHVIGWRRVQTA